MQAQIGQAHYRITPSDSRQPRDRSPLMSNLARCFLRLSNLPNYALDRLSRYEATLWRQAGQILYALDNLDRRKPQKRMRRFCLGGEPSAIGRED